MKQKISFLMMFFYFSVLQILEQRKVAMQFRVLDTTFARALDKSTSLEISDEVREQVNPIG
jgi:hypothetical protein